MFVLAGRTFEGLLESFEQTDRSKIGAIAVSFVGVRSFATSTEITLDLVDDLEMVFDNPILSEADVCVPSVWLLFVSDFVDLDEEADGFDWS